MSLIGQIWLKLFLVLVMAFLGSVAVHTDAMRETLQTQLRLKNSDNATALALVPVSYTHLTLPTKRIV